MNINGKFKKVWKVEVMPNLVRCDIGDSAKNKEGKYDNFTLYGVAFLGGAKDKAMELAEGDTIEILNGSWTKKKSEKDSKYYDNIVVFDFEITTKGEGKKEYTQDDFDEIAL